MAINTFAERSAPESGAAGRDPAGVDRASWAHALAEAASRLSPVS